jgi:hypothetical protein
LAQGGPREAAIRALLYIRMPDGVADERVFRLLERMREEAGGELSLAAFKAMVRDQFFTLLLDERRAIEAIPAMLDADPELASRMAAPCASSSRCSAWKASSARAPRRDAAMFESRKAPKLPRTVRRRGSPQPARPRSRRRSRIGPFAQFELRPLRLDRTRHHSNALVQEPEP